MGHEIRSDLVPLSGLSDERLVTAHLNGRSGAFRELHDRFEGRLRSFIRGKTGGSERVQDLLQETWLRVTRHLHRFDPDRKFSTWVFTIASNLCKNELRNRSRSRLVPFAKLETRRESDSDRKPLEFADSTMTPERLFRKREARRRVEETLATLSPDHRRVFKLREIKGLSYRNAAETLGLQLGTVKSRLHRARSEFARRVAEVS